MDLWDGNLSAKHVELHGSHGPRVFGLLAIEKHDRPNSLDSMPKCAYFSAPQTSEDGTYKWRCPMVE